MATYINTLPVLGTLSASDKLSIYSQAQGLTGGASLTTLTTYLQTALDLSALVTSNTYTTQYAAPSATAFNITIGTGLNAYTNVHLILTPTAGFAAGTITLPASTTVVDKQLVLVNCTQAVTTLTVAANGATAVTGAPTALAANGFFTLKYDLPTSTWYRVA